MTTRVLLVRHGATSLSADDRFGGATDTPLSEDGEHQARMLAARLRGSPLAAIYASPMKRTQRTAEILAEPHLMKVEPVEGLREIHHGRWEQLTRAEVEARFGGEYANWDADPFTCAPQGGESGLAVLARALPALRGIVEKHPEQTVLVISHKATIRLLIGSLLGFDLRGYRDRLDQSPCCLNVLDFRDATRARLLLYNDISHYGIHHAPRHASLSKWWDTSSRS
ncbi:MAG: histidine phosphatase family protein [Deltaproteobacteria bacterium]|nr:histidine phosphatase family protein [Deltaproteobacteria bacterium]